uniref:putative reverse transcriptase/maturase n=1 Tax=Erythrolobus coxiae TaxID=362235 RepID=UPI001FCDF9D6|nr:putative reverse transcriptase/maturase [Erythrolobus coxiae]UNJ17640.1 putative reverse transcriptase/maturase [Erythrolobus coxiae]
MNQINNGSIYHPLKVDQWNGVNWNKVEKTIALLQHRITKATKDGNYRKVRNLQRLLLTSMSARLKAVRLVTREQLGEKTPGIDGIIWTTPEHKLQATLDLKNRSKTLPLRRVCILEPNGSKLSLAIPSIKDRARQVLWNLGLLPIVEVNSNARSCGFHSNRRACNANTQLRNFLNKPTSPRWILHGKIEKYCDQLNHNWLLNSAPMETKVLKSWLKVGYFEASKFFSKNEEVLRESAISETLVNLTLNGLEQAIVEKIKPVRNYQTEKGFSKKSSFKVNVVRHADDFIITGKTVHQLEIVKKIVAEFLEIRGLKLSDSQTSIHRIEDGFNFLGWTFRSQNGKLLSKISDKSISEHKRAIKYITKTNHNSSLLIHKLNSTIRGWITYHRLCNDIGKVWSNMNKYLFDRLMKWGLRRHGRKSRKWIFLKYWKKIYNRWTFTVRGNSQNANLMSYSCRHNPILNINRI